MQAQDLGKKCVTLVTEFDALLKEGVPPDTCVTQLMAKHQLSEGEFFVAVKTGIELVERKFPTVSA